MGSPAELAARLRLPIGHHSLLRQALIHSSYPSEHAGERLESNERLEFMGDAVVALIVSEVLYGRHETDDEGELSTRRATIVSTRGLARIAARLGLGEELLLGEGAERSGVRARASVLAGSLEAILGAIYLDQGLDAARQWFLDVGKPELEGDLPAIELKAPKSRLQEHTFAANGMRPTYRVVSAAGPDHAKVYEVEVMVGGQVVGSGRGRNRRSAETRAAAAALETLGATLEAPVAHRVEGT
jgi:ribonuclease-3